MANKTLYDKRNDVDYNYVVIYNEEDIKESINKILKELIITNPDTINEYSNKRILRAFKQNFGDALVSGDEQ